MPINDSAVVRAPARRTSGTKTAPAAPMASTQSPNEKRTEGLLGLAQMGQGILLMTHQWADAAAVGTHFPPVAKELANIADSNETIAKPIDFLIEVGPYGALVSALMPLALQILANHRVIDATRLISQGVVPPEVLEAQMLAQVATAQAEAMKAQQQAMAEAQAAQKSYDEFVKSNHREDTLIAL